MTSNEDHLKSALKMSETSEFEMRISHDENCYESRIAFEEIVKLELRRHSERLNILQVKYRTRTDEAVSAMDSTMQKMTLKVSRDHTDAVDEIRRTGSARVDADLERVKRGKARLSHLTECVTRQEKTLSKLRRRNVELTTPVNRLEAEISGMEKNIEEYEKVVKPALEDVKRKVFVAKRELREKSLFLECLLQKNMLKGGKKKSDDPHLLTSLDMILDTLSVAETSVSA